MRWLHWNAGSSHLQGRRLEMLPRQTSTPGDGWLEAHNVRFGSKADILRCDNDVRFTPDGGHLQCTSACPLWAKSGHRNFLLNHLVCAQQERGRDRDSDSTYLNCNPWTINLSPLNIGGQA